MEQNAVPKAVRRLVIISSAFLVASMLISGFSAYATLAAPLRAPYVPDTVGFEGQLADSNGDPVTDGNYTITFSLYSVATGGSPVWNETQTVSVTDGLYSVQLGSVTSLDASDFEGDRWLGVQVSGDSEMTPRIEISAVPFALNARQAMGLQGRDVATTAPTDGDVLTWDNTASEWEPDVPGARTFPELNAVDNNEDPQDFFSKYRSGITLNRASSSAVDVSSGEIMIDGRMRRNSDTVTINFAGTGDARNLGLDTGAAQANTLYYVYAVADDDESVFDLIISASSSSPTGVTNYRQIGQFETDGSTNMESVVTTYDGVPGRNLLLYSNNTQQQVTGDATEKTIYSQTLPGGTLGTGDKVYIAIRGRAKNGVVNDKTLTVRLKYGGTTLATSVVTIKDNTDWSDNPMLVELELIANGTTGSQRGLANGFIGDLPGSGYGTATIDSTANQTLAVTFQNNSSNGNMGFSIESIEVWGPY